MATITINKLIGGTINITTTGGGGSTPTLTTGGIWNIPGYTQLRYTGTTMSGYNIWESNDGASLTYDSDEKKWIFNDGMSSYEMSGNGDETHIEFDGFTGVADWEAASSGITGGTWSFGMYTLSEYTEDMSGNPTWTAPDSMNGVSLTFDKSEGAWVLRYYDDSGRVSGTGTESTLYIELGGDMPYTETLTWTNTGNGSGGSSDSNEQTKNGSWRVTKDGDDMSSWYLSTYSENDMDNSRKWYGDGMYIRYQPSMSGWYWSLSFPDGTTGGANLMSTTGTEKDIWFSQDMGADLHAVWSSM